VSDQGYLEVKNWKQFQHYRDRDPQWIKLYRKVLADYEFSRLQDASKLLLICIWLLASEDREHRGRVPNDPEWIARRAGIQGPVDLQPLIDAGFLLLARRKQDASKTVAKRLPRDRDRVRDSEPAKETWLTPFADAWQARCGEPPFGKLAKVLAPLHKQHGGEALTRWRRYLEQTDPQYCSVHRFAETWVKWGGPEVQEMTDEFGRMVPHRKDDAGQWVPVVAVA
jgi:hypothetical protein